MKALIWGPLATLGLLTLYAVVMAALSRSLAAALEQFQTLWWLILPLAIGFGVQVALFIKIREKLQQKDAKTLAASGGSAAIGMLACCVHHTVDFLPILGLSALSIFLIKYQIPILLISLGINFWGILMMIKHLRRVYENK